MALSTVLAAASPPAGGAPALQIFIASMFSLLTTAVLLGLVHAHRTGRTPVLRWASDVAERLTRVPGWASLPAGIVLAGGASALIGVYWDISLHIDNGRDAGPLANPAHYFILLGLYGIFAGGLLALALSEGQQIGRAAFRLRDGWDVPVGATLLLACASFSLAGFPLDDVWHRLFGQDVTLWGPTHVVMIAGALMAVIVAFGILWTEGLRARGHDPRGAAPSRLAWGARLLLPVVILLSLGLFAGEFDWGVPQFRQVWHPLLLVVATGAGLTLARIWVGAGGALAAMALFVVIRLTLSLTVGDVLGQSMPAMPVFVVEALCVEAVAFAVSPRRRPLAFGAVAGLLCGTAGFAFEYGWSHLVMPLPWTTALLGEAIPTAIAGGIASGVLGALFALGLRGELPRPLVTRVVALGSAVALLGLAANALVYRAPDGVHASVTLSETRSGAQREAYATVRFDDQALTRNVEWVTVLAWQGGGLFRDHLRPTGDGSWRTTRPIPLHGSWKTALRVHNGRTMLATALYLPRDTAIRSPGLSLPAHAKRTLVYDQQVLQVERKDAPPWLWNSAVTLVLGLCIGLLFLIGVGVGRVARAAEAPREVLAPSRARVTTPVPAA